MLPPGHLPGQRCRRRRRFNSGGDALEVNALARELMEQVAAVNNGDLKRAEGMLIAQAHTLDALFGQ